MSTYLLVYQGHLDPTRQPSPEEGEAIMKAWGDWIGKTGPALRDVGAPTGDRARVGSGEPLAITGYSVVEADSLDAAQALCEGHPFLQGAPTDFSIDVYQLEPIAM